MTDSGAMKQRLEKEDAKYLLRLLVDTLQERGYSPGIMPDVFGILLLNYCAAAMEGGASKGDCEELVRYLCDKTVRLLGKEEP